MSPKVEYKVTIIPPIIIPYVSEIPKQYSNNSPAILSCIAINPIIPIEPEAAVIILTFFPYRLPIASDMESVPKNSANRGAKNSLLLENMMFHQLHKPILHINHGYSYRKDRRKNSPLTQVATIVGTKVAVLKFLFPIAYSLIL